MFEPHNRRAKVALVLFVAFLVGLTCFADAGHLPRIFARVKDIPGGDKLGHFVLYGILSFLVNVLFQVRDAKLGPFVVKHGSALVAALVTLEECSQSFFPSRTFDLIDLAADFAGIWMAARLAILYLAARSVPVKPVSWADLMGIRLAVSAKRNPDNSLRRGR